MIKSRRNELVTKKALGQMENDDIELNEIGIRKKKAFLDVLLESKKNGIPLTDLEIRQEVDTFMFEVIYLV